MKSDKIRTIHYGLGGAGTEVVRLLLDRRDVEIVGAIDPHPARAGKDVGEVLGLGRNLDIAVAYDPETVLGVVEADVVLHTTESGLTAAYQQVLHAVDTGKNVISDCEELTFPWVRYPELSERLDERARRSGVCILGAAVDPGFVMDTIPILLTTACQQIKSVKVTRIVDAAPNCLNARTKFGIGLSRDGFQQAANGGSIGYMGLRESVYMIADSLGWRLDDIVETVEPVIAAEHIKTAYFAVEKTYVSGLTQKATGFLGGREAVRLELEVSLGVKAAHDEIVIDGHPPIHVTIPGGIQGEPATAAVMVNCLPTIAYGNPLGLLSMRDMPIAPYRLPRVPAVEETVS